MQPLAVQMDRYEYYGLNRDMGKTKQFLIEHGGTIHITSTALGWTILRFLEVIPLPQIRD